MTKQGFNRELIVKYLSETASEQEESKVFDWLKASRANRKEFTQFKAFWIEGHAAMNEKGSIADTAYREFEQWANSQNNRLKINPAGKKKYLRVIGYAASTIIAVSLLATGYLLGTKSLLPGNEQFTEIEVPLGGKSNITLPDGTKVWLNAGSRLIYKKGYNKSDRNIALEGEAFFDVKKNKNLPFVVKTSHLDLQVLGTSFNVRSYPGDSQISTTLVEGKLTIEVRGEKTKNAVILKPNQSLIFYKDLGDRKIISKLKQDRTTRFSQKLEKLQPRVISNKMIVHEKANVEGEVTWKDGRLVLSEEPLANLARKLEREYNIDIHFEEEELKELSYSGTLLLDFPIEQIMEAIKLVSDINYTIKGREVNLSAIKKKH